ncbi:MDR family MFS transporter [Marmoricola sp. RAF53]|uniref:MDR family MFS transporter n=1 Tax=Marmoricola sp. RAF53 TaxID=3233059 RepID=UPI003F9B77EF
MTAVAEAPAPPDPVAPALSRRQINLVFATIMLGMLLAALDQTIVSTALPTIVGDLGGAQHVSWVVTAYLLTDTIATVLAGKFGDLFGRKLVFQLGAAIFVGASLMCALAGSMGWLVAWRAVQGVGAGALMVTSTALIADVIPLRERGKYQGALGAVFGVTTVIGPLLGGLFTDHLSWHWCFLVNIPIGIIVIAVAARTMPSVRARSRPTIDYAGIAAISVVAGGLVLATSLGGTEYDWSSPLIIGLFAAAILAIPVFIYAEQRAVEPMLPLRLFRNRVFSMSSIISLVVGFAMLGAMTFLPTYLQYVQGVSATQSGLRMLPMVFGLLVASIGAGVAVSRTGRYKVFPIAGSALMTLGLWLLSTMDAGTGFWVISAFMLVLGVGIGLCMQVLTIIVQNTAEYRDLGVATSGVTFFRALGSSFGAAVFGAVYSARLSDLLPRAIASAPGIDPRAVTTPAALHSQPAAVIAPVVDAYAEVLHAVFLYAAPVGLLAFVLSLFLPEVPLRDAARAGATDVGEGFGMAENSDPERALEVQLARLMERDGRRMLPQIRIASGTALGGAETWCVAQVLLRERHGVPADLETVALPTNVPASVLVPAFRQTVEAGYLTGGPDGWRTTASAREQWALFSAELKSWLLVRLGTSGPETEETGPDLAALEEALHRMVGRLLDEEAGATRGPEDLVLTA